MNALALVAGAVLVAGSVGALRAAPTAAHDAAPAMVRIPAGSYVPLYAVPDRRQDRAAARARRQVAAFTMAATPVTNEEYLEFVRQHPEWRRSRVKPIFADASYLRHWTGDLELGDRAPARSPVVNVSWFAARAFLKSRGQRLPTVDEWEYVAAASDTRRDASRHPAFLDRLRQWYARPTPDPLPPVASGEANVYGLHDLHGLVWEWTLDFNSAMVTGESRGDASLERSLYCGGGGVGAADFENYPAFMRFAFRSSLEARYAVGNLGFRGVAAETEKRR
jgi:formylglycine-generating enzyme required for sulfatase activity